MKLNHNCVRDVLIAVEDNTGYRIFLEYPNDVHKCPGLKNYSDDEIRYHIYQCRKAGLIEIDAIDMSQKIRIADLTPNGHSFLANIRSDTVWSNVKEVSAKVGSTSITSIIQIANGIVSSLIKSHLGL